MERRGYERPELDRCLKDDTMAQNLAETSISDTETYQIKGTPSFVLNGELLDQVHGWSALQPKLDAFFQ
jgi:protein-disulfide isomerase